jgi:Flp pilus assembly protein TadG
MSIRREPRRGPGRRAVAAVELALLLPFLMFVFLVAIDYCRVFYLTQVVDNCARNGAVYACDPVGASMSPYATLNDAAMADASPDIQANMTVTSTTTPDTTGTYVTVTVTCPFTTLTGYPGLPSQVIVSRSAEARVAPTVPK